MAFPKNWENGNLGASKSKYFEGDSIPYRLLMTELTGSSHSVTIEWDTTKSGKHAIDYLTSWDRNVQPGSDPCSGVACATVSGVPIFTTFPIPSDPNVTGAGVTPISGVFTLYGGTISSTSVYSLDAPYTGDSSTRITINFTTPNPTVVLAWGGHIATRLILGLDKFGRRHFLDLLITAV